MLLAVDTSTAQIGIGIYDGAQVIGEFCWRSGQRHQRPRADGHADDAGQQRGQQRKP